MHETDKHAPPGTIIQYAKVGAKDVKSPKLIHLLYVPTMFCNLGCQYCYLGSQTDLKLTHDDEKKALSTLTYALNKLKDHHVLPFNVSLHGGEVTSLSPETLDSLYTAIGRYYLDNLDLLQANHFKKISPHIKTNLFNFDQLYDLMDRHKVSVSASIDLPFFLHEKYRTTKNGKSSLGCRQHFLQNPRQGYNILNLNILQLIGG